jgi:hypothetical protein
MAGSLRSPGTDLSLALVDNRWPPSAGRAALAGMAGIAPLAGKGSSLLLAGTDLSLL